MAVEQASGTATPIPPKKEELPSPPDPRLLETNVKHNLLLISKAVSLLEPRFTQRALRSLPALRKLTGKGADELAEVIRNGNIYLKNSQRKVELLNYLGNPASPARPPPKDAATDTEMEVDTDAEKPASMLATISAAGATLAEIGAKAVKGEEPKKEKEKKAVEEEVDLAELPEGDVYVALLVTVALIDLGKYKDAKALTTSLIELITQLNRRTMDHLAAKVYFYWVRSWELNGDSTEGLRTPLLTALRTSTLRHDPHLLATLLPLLLRIYLEHHQYDEADRLVSKTTYPEGTAGNAELARWFYYVGRIRAIQLNYTEAHTNLQQAIRRAPEAKVAPGFLQTAHKLSIIVELLMGEIPERKTFRHPVLKNALVPYLEIAQAVRIGDLTQFNAALTTHSAIFTRDRTSTLILRLRHNVIKTALRTISLAYSRIPLKDVCQKLHLDSEEDAEYIIAKAIRDGVIEAEVDHEKGFMRSRELGDTYSTNEPMKAFDQRIKFLLDLHNQSVKAMRYPLNAHSKELATAGEARERERELAKEIQDADEDGEGEGPGDMDAF